MLIPFSLGSEFSMVIYSNKYSFYFHLCGGM
jgi:hypothetical protein